MPKRRVQWIMSEVAFINLPPTTSIETQVCEKCALSAQNSKNPARTKGDAMAGPGLRAALLKVHLWVGMAAALFLFALGLSGALLTFENTIDSALNSNAWYVKPQGTPLKLTQITQAIGQAFPQSTVEELVLPQKPDE